MRNRAEQRVKAQADAYTEKRPIILILKKWQIHFVARPCKVGKDEEMCPEVYRLVMPLEDAENAFEGRQTWSAIRGKDELVLIAIWYLEYEHINVLLVVSGDHLVIIQTRVGGLPPISKHQEELKIQGQAKYFLMNFEVF